MTPELWQRLVEIFDAVVEVEPGRRAPLLEPLCDGDAELRAELDTLLAAHDAAAGFLDDAPAALSAPTSAFAAPPDLDGQVLGRCTVLHRISEGGMSWVYLAERQVDDIRQTVALKVVQRDLHHPEVVRRFLRERRILASLDHPAICRLLDAGVTDDGRPYLVMPYLDGAVPLTEYCDRHVLGLRDRVKLFLQVCAAVQYAHQHLVVHADLKPANILVTTGGEVQLLDFGISRLLRDEGHTDATTLSVRRSRPVTPGYASPEQLRGEPPSTASDVYALGVLMYELLGGQRPYTLGTGQPEQDLADVHRRPLPPMSSLSAAGAGARGLPAERLRRSLSGDLDNIALKALQEEAQWRYPSAAALSEDLQRWLDGHPVSARAPTLGYQLGKFVRRHRMGVAAAAAGAAGIVVFAVTVSVLALRLAAESEQRAVQRDHAEAAAEFWARLFEEADPVAAGDQALTAQELVDRGLARLRGSADMAPEQRARLLTVLSAAYWGLGDQQSALTAAREATALHTPAQAPSSSFVRAYRQLANIEVSLEAFDLAHSAALSAKAQADALPDLDPQIRAGTLNTLALVVDELGDTHAAAQYMEEVVTLQRQLPESPEARTDLGTGLGNLAYMYFRLSRVEPSRREAHLQRADELIAQAIVILADVFGPEHPRVAFLNNAAGVLARERGDTGAALERFARALQVAERTLPESHEQRLNLTLNVADLLLQQGDVAAAHGRYAAVQSAATGFPPAHATPTRATYGLVRCALATGEPDAAGQLLRESLARLDDTGVAADADTRIWHQAWLARSLVAEQRHADAAAVLATLADAHSGDPALTAHVSETQHLLAAP